MQCDDWSEHQSWQVLRSSEFFNDEWLNAGLQPATSQWSLSMPTMVPWYYHGIILLTAVQLIKFFLKAVAHHLCLMITCCRSSSALTGMRCWLGLSWTKDSAVGVLCVTARVCSVVLVTVPTDRSRRWNFVVSSNSLESSPAGSWMIIICQARHAASRSHKLYAISIVTGRHSTLHNNTHTHADYTMNKLRPTAVGVSIALLFENERLSNWW